jgi:hypothetical protein
MPESNRVFVSHIHEDDAHVQGMRQLLADRGYQVQISAVDSTTPNSAKDEQYIKSEILKPKLDWTGAGGTLVVLVSPGTRDSSWVDWEIEYAQQLGMRIVGVWTPGAAESDVPDGLAEYADAVVGWQTDRIAGAIDGTINNWTASDGTLRDRLAIRRYGCR